MKSPRAMFFDLDGTLFDTRADLAAAVNHTRRELGLTELAEADVIIHVGQGAPYLLAHAIPEPIGRTEAALAAFRRHYAEHACERLVPYEGVAETLVELRRRGWLLGVVTNKPAFATRAILERFKFVSIFGNAVVAGGDTAVMKPSAEPLLECARRMGGHIVTARDWMVGDNWTDVECAANAGVSSAYCTFGFGRPADEPATVTMSRFADLLLLDEK